MHLDHGLTATNSLEMIIQEKFCKSGYFYYITLVHTDN